MLQTRINFSGKKNATMLTVRFFSNKTNTILERNLIVDQEDDRQSVLDYLAESLGEINILQYSSKNVLCIAERSRLKKQEARIDWNIFGEMSSVISLSAWINLVFIMICMSLAMLIRMMKKLCGQLMR